jgi:hypothetical protein
MAAPDGAVEAAEAAVVAEAENSPKLRGQNGRSVFQELQGMESIHPAIKAQPEIRQASCYTEPAPADEVMMEQLEYLLLHARNGRHPECRECARLDRIGPVLLSPFG